MGRKYIFFLQNVVTKFIPRILSHSKYIIVDGVTAYSYIRVVLVYH